MQYAILYNKKGVCSLNKGEDDAVMAKLAVAQERLAKKGKRDPVTCLSPTTATTTLRKDCEPPVMLDGPFA